MWGVQAVRECRPARAIQRWQSRILAQFTSVGVDRVRRMSCAAHAAGSLLHMNSASGA